MVQRGGVTFRHVGEGLVPHRQQRQQVEEKRHHGSHQQTAPAQRITQGSIQPHRVAHYRTWSGPSQETQSVVPGGMTKTVYHVIFQNAVGITINHIFQ